MNKERGYYYARMASMNSDFTGYSLGAAAFYCGKLLALGWNSDKTHPSQALYNSRERGFDGYSFKSTIHAEMMVINKIKYLDINFSKVKLFVWRGDDSPKMSRPCPACERALRDLGIKHVCYTGTDSYITEVYN